jgi:membrane protease YdiL (CAAX protease family)
MKGRHTLKRIDQISDKVLLLNLYLTQALTLILALVILYFQGRNPLDLFAVPSWMEAIVWGAVFACVVIFLDMGVSYIVPEHLTDDGGVNERIFAKRALWHILVISLVVSLAEELLFRGAIQHVIGPYWTSILFTAIHIRYLQHWIMTGMVFIISYGLGWLVVHTEMLMTAVVAHFLIDFILGCIIHFGWFEKKEAD